VTQGDQALAELAEDYFQAVLDASPFEATVYGVHGWDAEVPDLSEAAEAETDRRLATLERRLAAVDTARLAGQDRITAAMLARGLADRRAELAARWPELTVSAASRGIQTEVLGLVPKVTLATPEQAADYLERCAKLAGCLDQAGDRLRAGLAAGRTPPALGVRAAVRQLDAYLAGPLADDPLLSPPPPAGTDATRFRERLAELVAGSVRPAMARYRDLLAGEVLERARPDDRCGLAHLPDGEAVYRAAVAAHTTTDRDPADLHRLGGGRGGPPPRPGTAWSWSTSSRPSTRSWGSGCWAPPTWARSCTGCATTRPCASGPRRRSSSRAATPWPGPWPPSPRSSAGSPGPHAWSTR
jgi:uncharacterized protein (DUF885 family)